MKAYCHKTFPVRICWMEVFATYIILPVPSMGDSLFLSLPDPLLCTPTLFLFSHLFSTSYVASPYFPCSLSIFPRMLPKPLDLFIAFFLCF